MQNPLQVGTKVQHEKFGRGSITKIRQTGPGRSEIVVRFNETKHVTVTFATSDFDRFLTVLAPEDNVAHLDYVDFQSPGDTNKVRLKELEEKLRKRVISKIKKLPD